MNTLGGAPEVSNTPDSSLSIMQIQNLLRSHPYILFILCFLFSGCGDNLGAEEISISEHGCPDGGPDFRKYVEMARQLEAEYDEALVCEMIASLHYDVLCVFETLGLTYPDLKEGATGATLDFNGSSHPLDEFYCDAGVYEGDPWFDCSLYNDGNHYFYMYSFPSFADPVEGDPGSRGRDFGVIAGTEIDGEWSDAWIGESKSYGDYAVMWVDPSEGDVYSFDGMCPALDMDKISTRMGDVFTTFDSGE